jgi:hypothetical protein
MLQRFGCDLSYFVLCGVSCDVACGVVGELVDLRCCVMQLCAR